MTTKDGKRKYHLPVLAGALFSALPLTAYATANSPASRTITMSRDQPVTLEANQLDYDHANKMVIAQGKVEVTQGETVVLADTLTYDQGNNLIFAQGNVAVMEPDGNVYFADSVELVDNMSSGSVANMKARLIDNSLFAANEGRRVSEDVTELDKAVYSPCAIKCDDGTAKTPLWQVRADKAIIDRNEQTLTYRDAFFDVKGVPVLYTPYLSHSMPGADSKSGLLAPEYRHDNNLGHVVQVPVYWAIDPTRDLTTTLMTASEAGPVLVGDYRQLFDNGGMKLIGSITQTDDRDSFGNPQEGNDIRGHIFADGGFQPRDDWQWGFNIRRTTDDTYLRRYDFNHDPLLTSRIYGEGFNLGDSDRSYVVAQGLAFQGMQQIDDTSRSPLVMPVVDAYYQTRPWLFNSRFTFSGGAMSLTRDSGEDSRRLSATTEWMIPFVTNDGQIFEFSTKLRGDAYRVDDFLQQSGTMFSGEDTRVIPQASLLWRYPLINRFESASLIIEPTANFIASPSSGNSSKIPNEDSAVPEFTDVNLFSDNRFPGYDRVETGPRMSYGLRSQLQIEDDKYFNFLLGQAYRVDDDPLFPISNDLNSRFSDYVGKVAFSYSPFEFAYRFRADKDNYELKRSEVEAFMSLRRFAVGLSYLKLSNDPVLNSKEEIINSMSIRLTDQWTWNTAIRHDLQRNNIVDASTGFLFQNECLTLSTLAGRNYTSDRDYRESSSLKFQVLLKNLN